MAQKDYVKRPQAKKPIKNQANKRGGRNTRSPSNATVPRLKIITAIVVIGLFVFGLYRLGNVNTGNSNTNKSELDESPQRLEQNNIDSRPNSTTQVADKALETIMPNADKEAANLTPLPVLGEEAWEYIDSLPDYSVEVDAKGPKQSNKEFIMQCGSFRTLERAETLKAKIAFQGLESRILKSEGKNGLWYRVVLGPFDRKRRAEKLRHQLRNAKIEGCKIW